MDTRPKLGVNVSELEIEGPYVIHKTILILKDIFRIFSLPILFCFLP